MFINRGLPIFMPGHKEAFLNDVTNLGKHIFYVLWHKLVKHSVLIPTAFVNFRYFNGNLNLR